MHLVESSACGFWRASLRAFPAAALVLAAAAPLESWAHHRGRRTDRWGYPCCRFPHHGRELACPGRPSATVRSSRAVCLLADAGSVSIRLAAAPAPAVGILPAWPPTSPSGQSSCSFRRGG